LGLWLILAIHTSLSTSVTHDEIWHLPAGLRGWSGDFTPDRVNPPLSRLWSALTVRLAGITATSATNASDLGHQFVAEHDNYLRWYVLGRLANLIWPLLTAVLIYVWSLSAVGLFAARVALLCFLCCPNVLAHGALVTPDSAAMFGFLLTSYCLTNWLNAASWRGAIFLGLSLGLLQSAKFHGVVFYPVILLCGILCAGMTWRKKSDTHHGPSAGVVIGQMALVGMISLIVLAVLYGGQSIGHPLGDFHFVSRSLQAWQVKLSSLHALPMPVPADYLLGIDQQMQTMESPHPVFLDGVWQVRGFPDYFAKALLYKLSHGFQLLIAAGLFIAWRTRHQAKPWQGVAVWAPVLILFVLASLSDLQLGLRYILPIIPACALLAGRGTELLAAFAPSARMFLQVVLLVALLSPLRFHPHHLAYFNEFAGGPVGGRYHLLDSNLDWGQDLLLARDFLKAHADENPRFVYFGMVDPRREGIAVPLPPSRYPEPGLYLVSVNFVMGRPHVVWQPDGTHRAVDIQEFGYFRFFQPVARCGYSIDVYRITADDIRRAAAQPARSPSR